MDEGKETFWELVIGIIIIMIVSCISGGIIADKKLSFILGNILGSVVAVILAGHMYKTISVAVELSSGDAEKYTRKKAMIRSMVMVLAVVIALSFPEIFNLIGVILGVLGLKFSAFLQPLTQKYIFTKIMNKGR